MTKFKLIILILCCITHLVTAETAFDLIDIGISAESIAIGSIELGCQTAQCLFTNPALLDNKVNLEETHAVLIHLDSRPLV